MPELPEVQTTVNGLKKEVVSFYIKNFWTDLSSPHKKFKETIKDDSFKKKFINEIKNKKIVKSERRGKNILLHLSNKKIILIHLKMTGHMMIGRYDFFKKEQKWKPKEIKGQESLHDPYNKYIHAVFSLKKNKEEKELVFCDARKFGKITLIEDLEKNVHTANLGIEPLGEDFTFLNMDNILKNNKTPIKKILLDQTKIVGIGNIYSDEILWNSKIHPLSFYDSVPKEKKKLLYKNIKILLKKGVTLGGDSTSDYRNIYGEKGNFHNEHSVYRRNAQKCKDKKCKGDIIRIVVGGRGTHYCSKCQNKYAI